MPRKLRKAIYAALALWLVLPSAFVMWSHAEGVIQQAEADGYDIPFLFESSVYAYGVIGITADAAYNASWGWITFRENPLKIIMDGEYLFTARANRHLSSDGWRLEKAIEWCELLDRVDAEHCSDYANETQDR